MILALLIGTSHWMLGFVVSGSSRWLSQQGYQINHRFYVNVMGIH